MWKSLTLLSMLSGLILWYNLALGSCSGRLAFCNGVNCANLCMLTVLSHFGLCVEPAWAVSTGVLTVFSHLGCVNRRVDH